ncbi:hypothetical protein [Aestuariimicrobium sp. T2.26MG-19.2B]|uniref:hypothetical protein n=1 Tax=Aestuariimicrobium sp. T2.26MG-19.2B TaxID=3040679 RepID=UPI002477A00C|nr:hypothetical protein [Aestuariimicrobium sp. T2.26MG-19.2B]CAI9405951.1 hypothetical protein AESSP_01524 [Aestuariimicrobium sp. T2.26MG-19.2B]
MNPRLKTRHKVLIASAAATAGVVALAGSIDQGSLARTLLPTPGSRRLPAGLAGDVKYLRRAVRRLELGATRQEWLAFSEVLATRPSGSVDDLTLTTSEALAQFHNAATSLLTTSAHRLPVRFSWMADDLVVVKARPEHAELVGQRVLRIGGGQPHDVWPGFVRFIGGGTRAWQRNRSAWFFTVPAALQRIGQLTDQRVPVRLETEAVDGTVTVTHLTADVEALPGGPLADFRDRFPGDAGLGTRGWVTALDQLDEERLPVSQRRLNDLVWHTRLGDASYLRLLSSADGRDPSSQVVERAVADLADDEPSRYVVDVRYAAGGDYRAVLPLVRAVAERARTLSVPIRVVIGPNTVGGGLIAASQVLAHAPERTLLVGNEVGDELKFRGQGRLVVLPRSGLTVQLCHDWHDLSHDAGLWGDVWLPDKFLLQGVGQFRPDVAVQNTWRDYLAGTDRMLDAALTS